MKLALPVVSVGIIAVVSVFGDPGTDRALKDASIIDYSVDQEGVHHYRIPIAYNDADKVGIEFLTKSHPKILEVKTLTKKDGFHFTARKALSGAELYGLFSRSGDIPTFTELVWLSKTKAKEFPSNDYQIQKVEKGDIEKTLKMHGTALSDFIPIKRNCFDFELPMGGEKADRMLVVNTRAAMCIGHDNFSLRIINKVGEVMWQDLETLGGYLRFLQINIDEDEEKEILFHQDDHGDKSLMILDPKK